MFVLYVCFYKWLISFRNHLFSLIQGQLVQPPKGLTTVCWMGGAAVILPVWEAQYDTVWSPGFRPACLKISVCWNCPRAWGWEVWAWAAIWRDHWWCSLFNPLLTTPNPSIPLSRPLPEEEMKGPPVLVVGETQLPWIDEWLLCHASLLFACSALPYTPLLAAACL